MANPSSPTPGIGFSTAVSRSGIGFSAVISRSDTSWWLVSDGSIEPRYRVSDLNGKGPLSDAGCLITVGGIGLRYLPETAPPFPDYGHA